MLASLPDRPAKEPATPPGTKRPLRSATSRRLTAPAAPSRTARPDVAKPSRSKRSRLAASWIGDRPSRPARRGSRTSAPARSGPPRACQTMARADRTERQAGRAELQSLDPQRAERGGDAGFAEASPPDRSDRSSGSDRAVDPAAAERAVEPAIWCGSWSGRPTRRRSLSRRARAGPRRRPSARSGHGPAWRRSGPAPAGSAHRGSRRRTRRNRDRSRASRPAIRRRSPPPPDAASRAPLRLARDRSPIRTAPRLLPACSLNAGLAVHAAAAGADHGLGQRRADRPDRRPLRGAQRRGDRRKVGSRMVRVAAATSPSSASSPRSSEICVIAGQPQRAGHRAPRPSPPPLRA